MTTILASLQEIPLLASSEVKHFLKMYDLNLVKEHVIVDGSVPSTAFAVIMQDSSMEPYLRQGAVLILDPAKQPRDRDLVLVCIQGGQSLVFRQILINCEQSYLKPMNPELAAFPMRLLREEDRILGVLIEVRHRYDQ